MVVAGQGSGRQSTDVQRAIQLDPETGHRLCGIGTNTTIREKETRRRDHRPGGTVRAKVSEGKVLHRVHYSKNVSGDRRRRARV